MPDSPEWSFGAGCLTSGGRSEPIQLAQRVLLRTLVTADGAVVSRDRLWNALYRDRWLSDEVAPEAKSIDVQLCRLRDAFGRLGLSRGAIENVWGEGFRLVFPPVPGVSDVRPLLTAPQWRELVLVLQAAEKQAPGTINRCGLCGLIDTE